MSSMDHVPFSVADRDFFDVPERLVDDGSVVDARYTGAGHIGATTVKLGKRFTDSKYNLKQLVRTFTTNQLTKLVTPIVFGAIVGGQVVVTEGLSLDMDIVADARGLSEGQQVVVDSE